MEERRTNASTEPKNINEKDERPEEQIKAKTKGKINRDQVKGRTP
jgi:hypothetical protein